MSESKMANLQEAQGSEQLLFSFEDFGGTESTSVRVRKSSNAKPVKPSILATLESNHDSLHDFLSRVNAQGLLMVGGWRSTFLNVMVNRVSSSQNPINRVIRIARAKDKSTNVYSATMVYLDENLRIWKSELSICFDRDPQMNMYGLNAMHTAYCNEYQLSEWTLQKTAKVLPNLHFVQTESELRGLLERNYPYTAKWANESGCDIRICLLAPHIETLVKAGYAFAKSFFRYDRLKDDECVIFNRLCQQGTKPKDIFKTSKTIYSVLKDEKNLEIWDSYRKLEKLGKIGVDSIQQAYDQGYNRKDLEYFNSILTKTYNGKPVFTWNSLMRYLVRLDTFEAISRNEAFVLLNDYLSMCNQLHMEPNIDGDSLKREHDIAARNCRNRRDEILSERMQSTCEAMKRYDYSEGVYFIRGIRSHEDLLDEANQQHNCVACYGNNIAGGKSYIYVMREVARPDKSLITIELSPNGKTIRQKYLAYNQPIHNKSQSEFIERWMKHIRSVQ